MVNVTRFLPPKKQKKEYKERKPNTFKNPDMSFLTKEQKVPIGFEVEVIDEGVRIKYGEWEHIAVNMKTAIDIMNLFSQSHGKNHEATKIS